MHRSGSAGRRASPSVAYLKAEYQNGGDGLRIKARVAAAWCQHPHGHGFFEHEYLDFRGDRRIHVQVHVFPLVRYLKLKTFPKESRNEGDTEIFRFHYAIADGNLDLSVRDFVSHLRGSGNAKKPVVHDGAWILNFDSAPRGPALLGSVQPTEGELLDQIARLEQQVEQLEQRQAARLRAENWFKLKVLIALHDPPYAKPTVWDWDAGPASAGLPTLGKRR